MLTEMHAHVLYGLDDGARDEEEMLCMLKTAEAEGTHRIYCTPHFKPSCVVDMDIYNERLCRARELTDIEMHAGGEIYYTDSTLRLLSKGTLPTYDGTLVLLVEFSPRERPSTVKEALLALSSEGYMPVLAHAERMLCLEKRGVLEELKDKCGIFVQVNSDSLIDEYAGFLFKRRLKKWISDGIVDFVSSDAHGMFDRPFCLKYAHHWLRKNFDDRTADMLCGGNFDELMRICKG